MHYALDVIGGAATEIHPVGDQSLYLTARAGASSAYVAEVPAAAAGKKLVIDLFDPGDGSSSAPATIRVKAPPGGAPSPTPSGAGVGIPADGVATGCTYNAVGSTTIGPATPDVATGCTIATFDPSLPSPSIYNGKWLRIEVSIDPAYACTTDCWWTFERSWASGLPTDRVTYTAKVV